MESAQMEQSLHPGNESDRDEVHNQSIVVPVNLIATTDGFEKKDHSWFVTSQIPTDLSIQVEDITFYVHKYPLAARCGYLSPIELQQPNPNLGCDLKLENFPGGSEAFETVLKFCYGLPIGLNPHNVAALRCASEFLEMTEDLEDGNLISKTEAFFTFVVLSSWMDSIIVLNSCQNLSPWAENLQIVRRCCDSISWKASQENSATGENIGEDEWWFEDVATVRIDHFTRIIVALKAKGMNPEIIGSCIMRYAEKWLPSMDLGKEGIRRHGCWQSGLHWSITSGSSQEGAIGKSKEYRMIIENLVSVLPPQKEAVTCKFLLWMLKMALVFSTSQALISELEKRVGMVLEKANVNDLLIPTYTVGDQGKPGNMTNDHAIHDTDVVQRILEYFLLYEQQQQQQQENPGTLTVSKLLDNYLAEIAKDPNLSITKFQVLAESLPGNARTCHDGLYRAIDIYLKTHTSLSDHDRRRLCKIMNSEKLSLDACTHAAQNDRLPLRTVIQVLFSEQIKMRAIIRGKDKTASDDTQDEGGNWLCSKNEVNSLRAELESVKAKMTELQTDYFELQQEYGKLGTKQRSLSTWKFGWSKIKKPSLFHRKTDEEETVEGQNASHSDHKTKFRRRMSIS
ncbi:OLC1v1009276C1 [Oldenlandia corymbosa var. corymbosa]|uniref:OLC1v1009276C1 n=1 Tax=Oldenlandia corymbosa var. corymbosa TaxID=529605 RepID=A0AAV1DRG6_OLDCO|nr:OLC1v1009276C1 [Oldenlandia corymbosa var. corymbosa]